MTAGRRRKKVSTEPELGWLRNLPEVGRAIRSMADEEAQRLEQYHKLLRDAEALLGDIVVLRNKAVTAVALNWSDEDIKRATRRGTE